MNESDAVANAAATASTIQSAHASVLAQPPQAGTHMSTHISMSVANPMGHVARNSEFVGSRTITRQISGYREYRRIDMPSAIAKRAAFATKKIIDR